MVYIATFFVFFGLLFGFVFARTLPMWLDFWEKLHWIFFPILLAMEAALFYYTDFSKFKATVESPGTVERLVEIQIGFIVACAIEMTNRIKSFNRLVKLLALIVFASAGIFGLILVPVKLGTKAALSDMNPQTSRLPIVKVKGQEFRLLVVLSDKYVLAQLFPDAVPSIRIVGFEEVTDVQPIQVGSKKPILPRAR